ncbi:hypothetical protein OGZ01_31200 (plasmid) [Vibrio harveyi]|nr:hypothetical protein [Vibrio harveyi]
MDVLYVYGLDGELLAEVDAGTGQTQREYVWLDGTSWWLTWWMALFITSITIIWVRRKH